MTDRTTFGFWLYIMSDCVLFAGLFAVYAVLYRATFGTIGIESVVNLPYVVTETLLLLASSFTVGLALLAAHRRKKNLTLLALAATLVLGLGFLGMEVHEFAGLLARGSGPSHSAFLSSFFTLLGTHGLHVALGCVWMLVVMAHVWLRGLSESTQTKLMCLSMFWHFLDVVWVCIFTFVYLSPLFGAFALLALLQLCVQMYFLFYLEKNSTWKVMSLIFTLIVVVILIGGTLWIISNLAHGQAGQAVPFINDQVSAQAEND
jgi:cytochrome o ubiquinol oxidase subunit 3